MNQENTLKINDITIEYKIMHRRVKYPRLEIKTDILYVILPEGQDNARELIKKHQNWVYKKISHIRESEKRSKKIKLNLNRSDEELKELICSVVKEISLNLNVKKGKIKYRRMKSRWGSCNSAGNLNFNIYLKYLPQTLIEYIVFHETAHLLEMNHNKRFWHIISTEFPDYKEKEDELLIYWLAVKEQIQIN
ncbi:MAG: M48 family metallopeptidase [Methanobacterium sp.]|nr:M48 family metallopeptidase [Methanobacterium sp.]